VPAAAGPGALNGVVGSPDCSGSQPSSSRSSPGGTGGGTGAAAVCSTPAAVHQAYHLPTACWRSGRFFAAAAAAPADGHSGGDPALLGGPWLYV
jgi:hypothetical protein